MGTVRCRYPSSWVPLLACHGAHGWRASSACALGRAQQGGQGGHRAPCGGKSPQGCSGDPGGTQDWRSHVCPHPPCQGPEHPRAPGQEMGQGGGCRHHGNGVAQPQRWQPRCLPTPTVSQRCLFFPSPHATEPAAPSPVTLWDFNPAAPTGHSRMGARTQPGTRCVSGAGGRICPGCRSRQSRRRRERPGWQPAEPRCRAAVPGPGSTPAATKVTPGRCPAPPTCATCPEKGTWVPIPVTAQCCAAVPIPCCAPQQPWLHIPSPAVPYGVPYPAPPSPLAPHGTLTLLPHCTPWLLCPPIPVLTSSSGSSAPRPHLQPCRMSAAICLSLLISINF